MLSLSYTTEVVWGSVVMLVFERSRVSRMCWNILLITYVSVAFDELESSNDSVF